jgi:hypothetical protein
LPRGFPFDKYAYTAVQVISKDFIEINTRDFCLRVLAGFAQKKEPDRILALAKG